MNKKVHGITLWGRPHQDNLLIVPTEIMTKRIIFFAAVAAAALPLSAQPGVLDTRPQDSLSTRLLTMEEAVLGPELVPENMSVVWRPGSREMTTFEDGSLYSKNPLAGMNREIISSEDLKRLAGEEVLGFEQWIDSDIAVFTAKGKYLLVDCTDGRMEGEITLPEGARNLVFNPAGFHPYTFGNGLYFCDNYGNTYPIATSDDSNISFGQFVSRNEFGITGGIFLSDSGKKVAFYRKDESAVGTFPLLDINSRTGSLVRIKYPMAGMASENVRLGVYDFSSNETVYVDCDEFGYDQYLTGVSWSPDDRLIFIQVLDRSQKHLKLNMYRADTGEFAGTLLTEDNEKFVEPLECPFITHWLHNMTHDQVLDMLKYLGMNNTTEDKVKVIFVPCYLDGKDGIFNKSYYDLILGADLTVYASYYEPWGYTPLESVAFHVPTVTTDLAGFGLWVNSLKNQHGIDDGVEVLHRSDYNYSEVADGIKDTIISFASKTEQDIKLIRKHAVQVAEQALWKHFIQYYYKAYDIALHKSFERLKKV